MKGKIEASTFNLCFRVVNFNRQVPAHMYPQLKMFSDYSRGRHPNDQEPHDAYVNIALNLIVPLLTKISNNSKI